MLFLGSISWPHGYGEGQGRGRCKTAPALRAHAACLDETGQLGRMVAGRRFGGNDNPPHSPIADASAAAHDYIKEANPGHEWLEINLRVRLCVSAGHCASRH
jgi:hypothetical protein